MREDGFFQCEVCGYVHRGAAPPETCPVCGVGPDQFLPMKVAAAPAPPAPEATAWRCTVCNYIHLGPEPPETCPVCGVDAELFEPTDPEPAGIETGGHCIVILGAGIAGLTAAEHARETAPKAAITLVSEEPGLPYYRLNLSRDLAGEVTEQSLQIQAQAWFDERGIELRQGLATAISPGDRTVQLGQGTELSYDRLVLATGAHAFVPPIPGAELDGVYSFRTMKDAEAMAARAGSGRCVCVGGGLLGLETAGALSRQGMQVTVLEGAPALLPRQLAQPAARLLRQHLQTLGIEARCGVRIEQLVGQQQVQGVRLASGDVLPAELVVLSTGVRPNSHLARQCGLTVKTGVVVDDSMSTSNEAIFAAGDLCEHRGVLYGIWPASYAQGRVAGINAAGGEVTFTGLPPAHKLKVLDVDLFSIGTIRPEDGSYRAFDQLQERTFRRLVCRDGRLVGAVLYGDTRLAGEVREAVESGVPVQQVESLAPLVCE